MVLTSDISLGVGGLYALIGFSIVFFELILLMLVIWVMSKAVKAAQKKNPKPAEAAAPTAEKTAVPAPGSAGEVMLANVTERDAAMIMAIVADKMQKPLNQLRFISIREVK